MYVCVCVCMYVFMDGCKHVTSLVLSIYLSIYVCIYLCVYMFRQDPGCADYGGGGAGRTNNTGAAGPAASGDRAGSECAVM
jgi:hypothetical protein